MPDTIWLLNVLGLLEQIKTFIISPAFLIHMSTLGDKHKLTNMPITHQHFTDQVYISCSFQPTSTIHFTHCQYHYPKKFHSQNTSIIQTGLHMICFFYFGKRGSKYKYYKVFFLITFSTDNPLIKKRH